MNLIVEKYYNQLISSILDYGVCFSSGEFSLDAEKNAYIPVIDTKIGNPFFITLLSGNDPSKNIEIILQVFSIYFKRKIKTLQSLKNFQLDKNGSLQLCYDNDRIIIISEKMFKQKIFQNSVYEDEPILLINQPGIKNLGKMKLIDFDLWIGQNLDRFGGLEIVKGKIIMARNSIKTIDTLKEVNEINLNEGDIESLGSLEIIHHNCRLGSNLKSLGNLKYVGNDILIQSKNLYSLGNLEYVGNRLRIRNTNVIDLGNLKEVKGEVLIDRKPPPSLLYQLNERGFKFKKG